MIDLAQQRKKYVQSLDENLADLKKRLSEIPQVEQVILFGSYATGRRDLFTDLDIIVIMDTPLSYIERTAWLYRQLPVRVDLDLLVYTPQEFETLQTRPFIRHALEVGKIIYEK
jgi:predicted nucleotidyltransferase